MKSVSSFLLLVALGPLTHSAEVETLGSPETQPPNSDHLSSVDTSQLMGYWQSNQLSPLEYLTQKFRQERWVIVGEFHRVRHDVQLIASLVPRLHETTDVRHLALEFLCRDHTVEANRLVSADSYNRGQMIDFFREQFP